MTSGACPAVSWRRNTGTNVLPFRIGTTSPIECTFPETLTFTRHPLLVCPAIRGHVRGHKVATAAADERMDRFQAQARYPVRLTERMKGQTTQFRDSRKTKGIENPPGV